MNDNQKSNWGAFEICFSVFSVVIVLWIAAAIISPTGDIRDVFGGRQRSGGSRYLDQGEQELRRLESEYYQEQIPR